MIVYLASSSGSLLLHSSEVGRTLVGGEGACKRGEGRGGGVQERGGEGRGHAREGRGGEGACKRGGGEGRGQGERGAEGSGSG